MDFSGFTSEDDRRNAVILEAAVEKSIRKKERAEEDFRSSLGAVEANALRALQIADYSRPGAVAQVVEDMSRLAEASRSSHRAALKLAERIGRYSERVKFLRCVQGAKEDMRKMRDTLAVYSRIIRTYQEQ